MTFKAKTSLVAIFGLGILAACSGSNFAGNSSSAGNTKRDAGIGLGGGPSGGGPDGSGNNGQGSSIGAKGNGNEVMVPVGSQEAPPNLNASDVTNCVSSDPSVATVDPKTCKVTGVKTGTTQAIATMADGTTQVIGVQVTPIGSGGANAQAGSNISTDGAGVNGNQPGISVDGTGINGNQPPAGDGGSLSSSDGMVTQAAGQICIGGPACNISFLTRTPEDAQTCMQIANAAPCANDPKCGAQYHLQVCNCTCNDPAGLTFSDPTTCQRFNPEKGGGPRVTSCTKG